MFRTILLVAVVFAPVLLTEAYAQSSSDTFNRLNRLETEIDTLNRALYRGERPPPSAGGTGGGGVDAARVEIRLQQMETEIRSLTGRIEEDAYKIRQLEATVERLSGDLNVRLGDLERGQFQSSGGGAMAPAAVARQIVPSASTGYSAPAVVPKTGMDYTTLGAQQGGAAQNYQYSSGKAPLAVPGDVVSSEGFSAKPLGTLAQDVGQGAVDNAAGAYENSFSLLKSANYAGAEKGFTEFLTRYPTHVLAGNAKYWLGETYYVRGDYEQAARVFAEGYQQYPEGSKAADNLLKLSLSLSAVGNNTDSCVALRQLKQDYPKGAGPVLRRAEQEMAKLGC